jgi:hypothetical protein
MVRKSIYWIGAVLFFMSLTAYAGGPPIVTTSNAPEYFVVGQSEVLVFAVRGFCCDHGPLNQKSYTVRGAAGTRRVEFVATPTGKAGEYAVALTLPAPGDWAITIDLYGRESSVLAPQLYRKAILPGGRVPDPLSLAERGGRDFIEKGCITCHVNHEVSAPERDPWGPREKIEPALLSAGIPDLTGRTFPSDYLAQFLANPPSNKEWDKMPNLNLSSDDIAALVAFINRGRSASGSKLVRAEKSPR